MVKEMQVPAVVCYTDGGPACKDARCCNFKVPLTIDDVVRISAETGLEPEEFAALYVRSVISEQDKIKTKNEILDEAERSMLDGPGFEFLKKSGYFDSVIRKEAARQLNFNIDQKRFYTGFILKGKNHRNNVYTLAEIDYVQDECIFLKGNRCGIHKIKPIACEQYPYVPKATSKRVITGFSINERCPAKRRGYLSKGQLRNLTKLVKTNINRSIFYISMQELCPVPDNAGKYTTEVKEEQYKRIKQEILIPKIQSYKRRNQKS